MDKLFVNFLPPWVETNIQPAFYDKESGSVLQQTARMYAKVQCLVRMFNKLSKETKETVEEYIAKFVELKDFVDTYFENLDVQEEINNKLDEMLGDGTLETLLDSIFVKKQTGSLVLNVAYHDSSEYIEGVTSESSSNPVMGYFQGMCTTDTSIIYAVQGNGAYENLLNDCYLIEVSKSNGSVIKQAFLELYHANSIAYNEADSELYIVANTEIVDNDPVASGKVIIVDYDTFTIKDTITLPASITSSDSVMSVSYVNDKIYIGGSNKVYVMSDWSTVESTITLDTSLVAPSTNPYTNKGHIQETKVFGDYIYQLNYDANGIVIYDMTGKLLQILYTFETDLPINIGEMESIAVEEDGTLYVSSVQVSHMTGYKERLFDRIIWKSNIFYNTYKNFTYQNLENNPITLYVKPSTSNKLQYGTQTYPFSHIQQAMLFAEGCRKNRINVILQDATNYGFFITRCNKTITVVPSTTATLNCLFADGAKLEMNYITFDFQYNLKVDNDNYNFYTQYSDVTLNNCTVTSSDSVIASGLTTFHGTLKTNYCTFSKMTDVFVNKNLTTLVIGNPTWGANITKRFLNTGTVIIDFNNSQVFKNCDTTNGVLPINNLCYQYLDYTSTATTFTPTGIPTDRLNNFTLKAGIHLTIDGNNYYYTVPVKSGGSRFSIDIAQSTSVIYRVSYNLSYSSGVFTLTPTCFKIDVSNNTIANIAYTQEITSVITEQ